MHYSDKLKTDTKFCKSQCRPLVFNSQSSQTHILRANQITFSVKCVIIFLSSLRCSNTTILNVIQISAFHTNSGWLQFSITVSPVQKMYISSISQKIMKMTFQPPQATIFHCLRKPYATSYESPTKCKNLATFLALSMTPHMLQPCL